MHLQSKDGNGTNGSTRELHNVTTRADVARSARPLPEGWSWHLYGTAAELASLALKDEDVLIGDGHRITVHLRG